VTMQELDAASGPVQQDGKRSRLSGDVLHWAAGWLVDTGEDS
jgi:hypothetical protein